MITGLRLTIRKIYIDFFIPLSGRRISAGPLSVQKNE